MGEIDQQTKDAAQAEYDARLNWYQEQNGELPQVALGALVYQAVSQIGKANLTGIPLSRVSIHTRLAGARHLTPEYE